MGEKDETWHLSVRANCSRSGEQLVWEGDLDRVSTLSLMALLAREKEAREEEKGE